MMEGLGRSKSGAPLPVRSDLLERTLHDLKNPLAVVRATLEWLEIELRGRADALDAVHDASTAAGRLVSIVDEFGIVAQLETGGAVARESLDLRTIVEGVAASADARLASRRIAVAASVSGPLPMVGDEKLLARAIEAFVDVSARGSCSGSCIEVGAHARPSRVEQGTEMIELTVGLRGLQTEAAPIPSIDALSSGGLGVYLAQRVIEGHGGSVAVVPTSTVPRILMLVPR